jgi:anti-sigma B factor antagonist
MDQKREKVTRRLHTEIAWTDSRVVIDLAGELDVSTVPSLQQELQSVMAAGASEVHLALEHVAFADSTGLSLILMTHKRLHHEGGSLILNSPSPNVLRLLEISGLRDHLTIQP